MPRPASYYDILEIPRRATQAEIGGAYNRQLAKLQAASAQTPVWRQRQRDVEEAFRVLSHQASRAAYDQEQAQRTSLPPASDPERAEPDTRMDGEAWPVPGRSLASMRATTYPLRLASAQRTARGFEIVLAAAAEGHVEAVRSLRQRIPAQHLVFEPTRNVWVVAAAYEQSLRDLCLNFDFALSQPEPTAGRLAFPRWENAAPAPRATPRPAPSDPPAPRLRRLEDSPLPVSGIVIGLLVLLIGWNLYILRAESPRAPVQVAVTPRPTRAPITTPTFTPTVTPTPYSFVTTTRYPRVRLRSRPDLNAPILGDLLAGEEFTAWGRTAASDWVRIRRGEQEGWSAAWTLNVEDQLPRLPVMTP